MKRKRDNHSNFVGFSVLFCGSLFIIIIVTQTGNWMQKLYSLCVEEWWRSTHNHVESFETKRSSLQVRCVDCNCSPCGINACWKWDRFFSAYLPTRIKPDFIDVQHLDIISLIKSNLTNEKTHWTNFKMQRCPRKAQYYVRSPAFCIHFNLNIHVNSINTSKCISHNNETEK